MNADKAVSDAADDAAAFVFQALDARDWKAARSRFTPRFRAALSEAGLAAVWRQVTAGLGRLADTTIIDRTDYGDLGLRVVALAFARGTATGRVSFHTPTGEVEGLAVEPPTAPS
jgi:hypothetical protein